MIWGFAFVAQSVAMNDIGPLTFNAARSLLGAVSLLPVLLLSRREAPPVKAAFPRWLGILFAGLIFPPARSSSSAAFFIRRHPKPALSPPHTFSWCRSSDFSWEMSSA